VSRPRTFATAGGARTFATAGGARTFAVVGGGISGLVAAYRIRAAAGADAQILVFDPADRLGGVLRTETMRGQPMDIGAEAFVARRPEVPALLRELGLADRLITPTGVRPTIYSRGRLHPLPPGAVNGIPGSAESLRGLVDEETLNRVAAEPDRPLRWQPGDDPAVGDLVADRFGEQVVTRSVDPMLSGVYAGSAGTIGIRSAVPTVAAALDAGAGSLTAAVARATPGTKGGPVFAAVDGGYRVLVDELIRRSGPRWIPAQISDLRSAGGGWTLVGSAGQTWHADAVVLAVPAPQTARLLSSVAPASAAAAELIPVASAVVLAMAVPPGTPFPPQSGVLVATGEALHAKAITLSTRKWGRRGEAELLRLSFGRFGDDVARTVTDDQLQCWAVEDLATVFGIAVQPLETMVHRWIDALPQYGPGHGALAARIRAGLPPGLALAGNFLDGVGVPACLLAAGKAAERVVGAAA
jgi:oxygen-dependent protoporphyrinogen oxidase